VLFFSLASAVAELLTIILLFFTILKLKNISGTYAATWQQKLAADIPSLEEIRQGLQTKESSE
jgi:hypothetical protein